MFLQGAILSARSQYEADLVNGCAFGDSRRIFQYINHTLKQHSLPDTMTLDSSSESSDFGKATLFNHSFHSVFSSPGPPPDPSSLPPPACLLDELEITVHDVFVSLSHLGSKKSMGIDHIPSIVLKSCATVLCEPVYHLFTLCLSQSYIPPEWKIHCVTPIFKSGDKVSVKNYRPVSLLCIISKVFERIVFDKIYDHIASFIICSEQYGFMRKRSTIQQLLIHLHSLIDSVSSGHQSDVVYLDIKKAFDSVSHSILLTKLWSAGLCGATWRFFVAYLSGAGSVSELAVVSLICCLLPRGFHKAVSWVLFSLFCILTTFRQSLFILLFCFLLMIVNAVEKYSLLRIPSYCRVICVGCVNGVTPLVSFLTVARVVSLAITLPGLILSLLITLSTTKLLIIKVFVRT